MQKKTHDYDNVFKTMKAKHKRLFVSVINDVFGKSYPLDVQVEVLPSEGYLTEDEAANGGKEIEEREADFLIRIGGDIYLLESQSYDDDSMAIRIAEYAFSAARRFATWDIGEAKKSCSHTSPFTSQGMKRSLCLGTIWRPPLKTWNISGTRLSACMGKAP